MRKLTYISKSGKETSSWDIAKSWNESYTVKLTEVHKPFKKWHNPKYKKENERKGIDYND